MRSSRETELAKRFPIHVVCQWIGNTPAIAAKHYLQVMEEDYVKATKRDAKYDAPEAQKPTQQPSADLSTYKQETTQTHSNYGFVPKLTDTCNNVQVYTIPPRGDEQMPDSSGKTEFCIQGNAQNDARSNNPTMNDPDLQFLVDSWPTLSAAAKAGIMAIIKAMG